MIVAVTDGWMRKHGESVEFRDEESSMRRLDGGLEELRSEIFLGQSYRRQASLSTKTHPLNRFSPDLAFGYQLLTSD